MSNNHAYMTLPIGTALQNGKYQIESVLGKGGFGITYLANASLGKVAIKELFLNSGNVQCTRDGTTGLQVLPTFDAHQFEQFKTRFFREAQTQYGLRNITGVVKTLDVFEENQTVYFAMEYLEGEKLDDYVKAHAPLTFETARRIIYTLGNTLTAIHKRGVLHCDVKPSNVIISPEGDVTLFDFGIARTYDLAGNSKTHTTFFSERYSPPEQKQAQTPMGEYSDVFSLAATAYYVLSGMPPQASEDILLNQYKPLQHVSVSINKAIQKGLELQPSARYQTILDFLNAFNTADDQPPLAAEHIASLEGVNQPDEATKIYETATQKQSVKSVLEEDTLIDASKINPASKPLIRPKRRNLRVAIGAGLLCLLLVWFWGLRSKPDPSQAVTPIVEDSTTAQVVTVAKPDSTAVMVEQDTVKSDSVMPEPASTASVNPVPPKTNNPNLFEVDLLSMSSTCVWMVKEPDGNARRLGFTKDIAAGTDPAGRVGTVKKVVLEDGKSYSGVALELPHKEDAYINGSFKITSLPKNPVLTGYVGFRQWSGKKRDKPAFHCTIKIVYQDGSSSDLFVKTRKYDGKLTPICVELPLDAKPIKSINIHVSAENNPENDRIVFSQLKIADQKKHGIKCK